MNSKRAIFYVAAPLFFIGILACMLRAYLELRLHNDWTYVVIANCILVIGMASISSVVRHIFK